MKNAGEVFERVCVIVASLIGGAIFFALTHWAAKYTHAYPDGYSDERVYGVFDNRLTNWVWLVGFIVILFVVRIALGIVKEEKRHKFVHIVALCVTVIAGGVSAVWVAISHSIPVFDQMQVIYAAQEYLQGNFAQMKTYFATYPHQYGMTFLFEPLFAIWNSYKAIQYANVLFIMIIIYFLYRAVDVLFENDCISLYTVISVSVFTPLYIYVNFAYGELWSMSFATVSVWAIIAYWRKERPRYIVIAIVCMSIATIARKNVLIWALAISIILLVKAIKKLQTKLVVYAALMMAVPLLCLRLVHFSYECRSGIDIVEGTPNELYVAMGLQDNWQGAGVYNGYNNSVFNGEAGCDAEVAKQIGRTYIEDRVKEFWGNPAMARHFFLNKICQQWNEVTYGSLFMTATFDKEPEGIVEDIYYGNLQRIILGWQERYVFALYACITAFALISLAKKRDIHQMIYLVIIVGGFLFSLIWEAKSRYVFPHTICALPLFACAIYEMQSGVLWCWNRISNVLKNRKA